MIQTEGNFTDEWLLDNPQMRTFIDAVNDIRLSAESPHAAVKQIRPYFAALLADQEWLPQKFMEPAEGESGMGSKIGMWLLYRSGDGGLAFSALVLPSGVKTPVHDHLAWGLVGLYRGKQSEEVFERHDHGEDDGVANLVVSERNLLTPGDFYELMPEKRHSSGRNDVGCNVRLAASAGQRQRLHLAPPVPPGGA